MEPSAWHGAIAAGSRKGERRAPGGAHGDFEDARLYSGGAEWKQEPKLQLGSSRLSAFFPRGHLPSCSEPRGRAAPGLLH